MPNKMERFTQRARRVLGLAQEEAERLQHNYIGAEHMLLGLMREEDGVAGRVLRDLGVYPQQVEELVERMSPAGHRTANTRLDLTPGTKKILELAVDEARRMGHHYIGTEHLLLGLTLQTESVAVDVLKRLNISPEEVRRHIRRVLQESSVQAKSTSADPKPTEATESQPQPRKIERFSKHTLDVLAKAQENAERYQHQFIGLEHLLLALVQEEGEVASFVLLDKGVKAEAIDYLIQQIPSEPTEYKSLHFDPNMKKSLEWAVATARELGQSYVGTEHLLIGLARQSAGALLLQRLELNPKEVISATQELAGQAPRTEEKIPDIVTSIEAELLNVPAPRESPKPSGASYEVRQKLEPQRFAGEWRITLAIARAEAIRLKSKLIEPEHLLIALLIDEGDRTGKLLRNAGVDLERTLEQAKNLRVDAADPVIEAEMSPKMIEILGIATTASWKSRNYYIQVEHLLLGLLRHKENAVIDILRQQNIALDELEKATLQSVAQ